MPWNSPQWKPSTIRYLLAAFFAIGFLLRIHAAEFPNIIHPDATFQTLEPAHRLAFGYGVITWEWREGVRSWVFPAFLAAIMKATAWLGPGSSGYLWGISAVLSLLSLVTIWFGFVWARRASGLEAALIAAGACAVWYDLIDFAPYALTGIMATYVLLPGLYFGQYENRMTEGKRMFIAALFCGLAVSLRVQLAPAIGFALVYFCSPNWRKRALPLAAGVLLPLLVFGLVDAFTWSYPFQSFFKDFWVNLIQDRSADYGIYPWFWYLIVLLLEMGPLILLAAFGFQRSPLLGWFTLIVIASHSLIAHKEFRFIYSVIPLITTLAAIGLVELARHLTARSRHTAMARNITVVSALTLCCLLSYRSAPLFPYLQKNAAGIAAFDRLSRDPAACGVGLYGLYWYNTGGYAHLHKHIPILLIPNEQALRVAAPMFNALLVNRADLPSTTAFKSAKCWTGGCLYMRPGPCKPPAAQYEINTALRAKGQ